jgi:two-component system nitrogen regulation sensor histidine kinase NtrY
MKLNKALKEKQKNIHLDDKELRRRRRERIIIVVVAVLGSRFYINRQPLCAKRQFALMTNILVYGLTTSMSF